MKLVFRKTIFLSLLLLNFLPLHSQVLSKNGLIKAVQEADIFYYYDQNYEKAASLYESLLNSYPSNSNFSAKLGICYLNIDGQTPRALKLLTNATKNVVTEDKDYLEWGEKAPLDTYLYLAIAYHKNDSLLKAISTYYEAKKKLSGTKIFKEEYIDKQIGDCRYAVEMKKKPLTIESELFTSWLGDYPGACNPVLAKNDSVFVFTQKENGKTRILCSYKSKTWKRPVDITKQLGGFDRFYSNSITGDGKTLIIYMDDGGDGNLYYAERKDSSWTKIRSVGRPINSIYWQSHGFITPDGNTMYFSSNKPGGEGGLDIWYSERTASGKWGEPINCGNVINTPYNEDTPFFDQEHDALIFSSEGHISMGGYDVFRSVFKNGSWTNPIGMPYSFNNILENSFFILNNNKPGFITSLYNDKSKARNIYAIVADDPADKITVAKGTITLQDGMSIDQKQIRIWMVNLKNPNSPTNIEMSDSASFKFDFKPGDYRLFVSHKGYKTDTINLNIPLYFAGNYVSVNASLVPDKVYGGEFLTINNVLFDFNSFKLTDEAKTGLEVIKSILTNYPGLNVEIAGYTDAIGSKEYNTKLADKRAQVVIDYLLSGSANAKFLKKAYGKSNFVAVNSNIDGSDNPEGRKYNRRVAFGIVDPKTGITIRQETYTPEHLRQPNSMRYSIVLLKTKEVLQPSHFSALTNNDLFFIRTIKGESDYIYSLGVFYNRIDALNYLENVKQKGFSKSYISNQYDLENESELNQNTESKKDILGKIDQTIFTIQLKATRNPLNIAKIFSEYKGVKEHKAGDGFYKYYYGEFESLAKAKEALLKVKQAGIEDAFVRNLYMLMNQ